MADWKLEVVSNGHIAESAINQLEWVVYNPDGVEFHRGVLQYPPGAPREDVEESLKLILQTAKDSYVNPEETIKVGHTIELEKKKRKLMPNFRRKNKEEE